MAKKIVLEDVDDEPTKNTKTKDAKKGKKNDGKNYGEKEQKGGKRDISEGVVRKRGCTDIVCLVLFLLNIGAFVGLMIYSYSAGDIDNLINGHDSHGRPCGGKPNKRLTFDEFKPTGDSEWIVPTLNVNRVYGPSVVEYLCVNKDAVEAELKNDSSVKAIKILNNTCQDGKVLKEILDFIDGIQKIDSPEDLWNFVKVSANKLRKQVDKKKLMFNATCVKNCDVVNKLVTGTGTSTRRWDWQFEEDWSNPWMIVWNKYYKSVSGVIKNVDPPKDFNKFPSGIPAMSASDCPYPAHRCIVRQEVEEASLKRCMWAKKNILSDKKDLVEEELENWASSWAKDGFSNSEKGWWVFIVCALFCFIIGIIFIILLRFILKPFVWTVIILNGVIMLACAGALLWYGFSCKSSATEGSWGSCGDGEWRLKESWLRVMMAVGAGVVVLLALLYYCIVWCMKETIRLAIALNKIGTRFVYTNKRVLIIPCVLLILTILWWLIWLFATMHAVSISSEWNGKAMTLQKATDACADYNPNRPVWKDLSSRDCADTNNAARLKDPKCYVCGQQPYSLGWLFWVLLFQFFWVNCFFIGVGIMMIGGMTGEWYFNSHKKDSDHVWIGFYHTFRYNLGTVAFGSFILAIVKTIRVFIEYCNRLARKSGNPIARCVACCLLCLIKCIEKFLEFLTSNAYIRTALTGENFCTSAIDVFKLFGRNAGRFVVVAGIGQFMEKFGVIFICIAGTAFGYLLIWSAYPGESYWFTIFILIVITYVVGKIVMTTVSRVVDTCLICFASDEELNGSDNLPYAPKEICKLFKIEPQTREPIEKKEKKNDKPVKNNDGDVQMEPVISQDNGDIQMEPVISQE